MVSLVRHRLILGAIVCALLLVSGYLALVQTAWGHTLDNAGYFGRSAVARTVVDYDYQILGAVSIPSLGLAIVVILLIGAIRRCLLGAIILAAGFVCAVVGAELLKHVLPWHALVPEDSYLHPNLRHDTYPSGHTTVGTSLALALLLVSSAGWRPWLAVLAGFMSASFATGVLFAGWHRPSDALGGIVWSGLCISLAAIATVTWCGREIRPIQNASSALVVSTLFLVVLLVALVWSVAGKAGDDYPDADAPFLILTLLIVFGSFAVTAWFGWQLRAVDWRSSSSARHGVS
jgi:membrane-associated phospholipid phosphatase